MPISRRSTATETITGGQRTQAVSGSISPRNPLLRNAELFWRARVGLKRRSAIGYNYVHRTEASNPIRTTATANELASQWGDMTYECFTCGHTFEVPVDHAVRCWEEHPSIPTPSQVRLE